MERRDLSTARELATHTAEIKHLRADMDKMVQTIDAMNATLMNINATLSEAKGGWRMLMLFGGAGGAIGAMLASSWQYLPWTK